jgi:SAM-dependent methyltransferase
MARLDLTGERTAPGWEHEQYWFARHEIVYRWLIGRFEHVADIGSGEGFGTELLRTHNTPVIAVELDVQACQHARVTYPHVPVVCANAVALPLADQSVDVAVSFQTIEHLWNVPAYLAELRRIATRGVVISTPNRPTFSPGLARGMKPTNPFHVEEFDADQMHTFVHVWATCDVLGLHHGPRIRAWEADHGPIVPQLITCALTQQWDDHLNDFQSSITSEDFQINSNVDGALDLIAMGFDQ